MTCKYPITVSNKLKVCQILNTSKVRKSSYIRQQTVFKGNATLQLMTLGQMTILKTFKLVNYDVTSFTKQEICLAIIFDPNSNP
jgi:hypothetical protein